MENYETMIEEVYEAICQDFEEDLAKDLVHDSIGTGLSDMENESSFLELPMSEREVIIKRVLKRF
jgi:hypothetical protein